LVRARLW